MTAYDAHRGPAERPRPATRIHAEDTGRGLGRLVMALLEIIRQLIERQAVRRVDSGRLTPDQVERLGQALIALEAKFAELREVLEVDGDGPLPLDVDQVLNEGDTSRTGRNDDA